MLLQSFYRNIAMLDYEINFSDYLAKCVNKSRPQLHCNGQCVLMKKIKAQEDEEKKKVLIALEANALYFHQESQDVLRFDVPESIIFLKANAFYVNHYQFNFNSAVFRPPLA